MQEVEVKYTINNAVHKARVLATTKRLYPTLDHIKTSSVRSYSYKPVLDAEILKNICVTVLDTSDLDEALDINWGKLRNG